jgi:hypothetical protein
MKLKYTLLEFDATQERKLGVPLKGKMVMERNSGDDLIDYIIKHFEFKKTVFSILVHDPDTGIYNVLEFGFFANE